MGSMGLSILALALLSHAPGVLRVLFARLSGMRVDRVVVGGLPIFRRGRLHLGIVPVGTWVLIAGRDATGQAADPALFRARPWALKLLVLLAGPIAFYVVAAAVMAIVFIRFGLPVEGTRPMVGGLRPGGPAERSGLERDDLIVAIDGRPMTDTSQVAPAINAGGRVVEIEVERDGQRRTIRVEPIDDGQSRRIGIEIWAQEAYEPAPLSRALPVAVAFPIRYSRFVLAGMKQIALGKQKVEFSGPIGTVKVTQRQVKQGWRNALSILAIMSVYFGLQVLLYDAVRTLAFLFRRRPAVGARDLGVVTLPTRRMPVGIIITFAICGLGALGLLFKSTLSGQIEGGLFIAMVVVGLLGHHPAAWSLLRTFSLLAGLQLLLVPNSRVAGALSIVFFGLISLASTRYWFGLHCTACDGGDARAVVGERGAFGCLRCGSAWRISRAHTPAAPARRSSSPTAATTAPR
jgi:regulator of sigma E protease